MPPQRGCQPEPSVSVFFIQSLCLSQGTIRRIVHFLIEYFPSLSATKSHFVAQADSNLYNPPVSASQVWELPHFTKLIFSIGIM